MKGNIGGRWYSRCDLVRVKASQRDAMSITPSVSWGWQPRAIYNLAAPSGRDYIGSVTPRWGYKELSVAVAAG